MLFRSISGDAQMDRVMRAADMFEDFKHIGNNWSFHLETVDPQLLRIAVDKLVLRLREKGQFVTAVWVAQQPQINFVDWSVVAVSTGSQWFVLSKYLEQFGIVQPAKTKV